jgi:hypothetical protein
MGHTLAKGDASEKVWLELLKKYLPQRYQAESLSEKVWLTVE